MKIDVLGTEYTVHRINPYEQIHGGKGLDEQGLGGFCDFDLKEIYVADMSKTKDWDTEPTEKIVARERGILRHEIVHAFLFESGLNWDSSVSQDAWAKNEEMVDWFAIQGEKIYNSWQKAEKIFFAPAPTIVVDEQTAKELAKVANEQIGKMRGAVLG